MRRALRPLVSSQRTGLCFGALDRIVAEDMRVPSDHLVGDALSDSIEVERAFFLGHARVIDDLQQQIAEFIAQFVAIIARNRLGNLIRLFDGVGRDGLESLLDVPRASPLGIAQAAHDVDQGVDGSRAHAGDSRTVPGSMARPL